MSRVTLGEVCREYKGRAEAAEGLPVVGLEHLSQSDIDLVGCSHEATTFTKAFRKGHVLFGRRRAYLKKASLAPFDGVCSGDIIVIEAVEGRLLPRLLPFVIQNDYLFDFAVENSAGSLSPRVKWKDLSRFEFELPSMEKQHELADLLWAAQEAKRAYSRLVSACDEIVKSRFVEMFGDLREDSSGFPRVRLDEIASTRLGKMLDAKKQTGRHLHPYLGNHNVQWFSFDFSELAQMDFDEADQVEFGLRYGDLLMCEGGEVGRCAIWRNELDDCFFQKAIHRIRCDKEIVLPEYLAWHFKLAADYGLLVRHTNTATIAHLSGIKLKALKIPVPPIDLQEQFVGFVSQVDKSELFDEMAVAA